MESLRSPHSWALEIDRIKNQNKSAAKYSLAESSGKIGGASSEAVELSCNCGTQQQTES